MGFARKQISFLFSMLLLFFVFRDSHQQQSKSFITVYKEGRNKISVIVTVNYEERTITTSPLSAAHNGEETLSDFKQNIVLRRLRMNGETSCYLEHVGNMSFSNEIEMLHKVKGNLIRDSSSILLINNTSLSRDQIGSPGNAAVDVFCKDLKVYRVVPLPDGSRAHLRRNKRAAHGRGHQPAKKRFYGQVEAQVSPADGSSSGPEAFAIASPDAAVTKVGGSSGFAHAKSQVRVESDYGHGKAVRTMSSSSTFSSSRGMSGKISGAQHMSGTYSNGAQQGTFPASSHLVKGQAGHGQRQHGYTQGFQLSSSSSSSLHSYPSAHSPGSPAGQQQAAPSTHSASQGNFAPSGAASQALPVPQSASTAHKTYQWKVKHPNGYNVAHWYTGPVGSDSNPGTVEGPLETAPLYLGGQSSAGGRTVIAASASGGGDLRTIGVGISPSGSILERAHAEAQSILSTQGHSFHTHQPSPGHYSASAVQHSYPASQTQDNTRVPHQEETSAPSRGLQHSQPGHVIQQQGAASYHSAVKQQTDQSHSNVVQGQLQGVPGHSQQQHGAHHSAQSFTSSHTQEEQHPALRGPTGQGQVQRTDYHSPQPVRQPYHTSQPVHQETLTGGTSTTTIQQAVQHNVQPGYIRQAPRQPQHLHEHSPIEAHRTLGHAATMEAMAQDVVTRTERIPTQQASYPVHIAQPLTPTQLEHEQGPTVPVQSPVHHLHITQPLPSLQVEQKQTLGAPIQATGYPLHVPQPQPSVQQEQVAPYPGYHASTGGIETQSGTLHQSQLTQTHSAHSQQHHELLPVKQETPRHQQGASSPIFRPVPVPQPGQVVSDVRGQHAFQVVSGRIETVEEGSPVLQPGQQIPQLPGSSVPQGFRGRIIDAPSQSRHPSYENPTVEDGRGLTHKIQHQSSQQESSRVHDTQTQQWHTASAQQHTQLQHGQSREQIYHYKQQRQPQQVPQQPYPQQVQQQPQPQQVQQQPYPQQIQQPYPQQVQQQSYPDLVQRQPSPQQVQQQTYPQQVQQQLYPQQVQQQPHPQQVQQQPYPQHAHQQTHPQQVQQPQYSRPATQASSASVTQQQEYIPSPQELVDSMSSSQHSVNAASSSASLASSVVAPVTGHTKGQQGHRPSSGGGRGRAPGTLPEPIPVQNSSDTDECVTAVYTCKIVYGPYKASQLCLPPPPCCIAC